jgi:hypothetical protein
MGRDTYSGGGSILRIGQDGLEWTSSDPAESKKRHKRSKHRGDRAPSQKEIERQAKEDNIEERKLIRSFISQCATAYVAEKLTASCPEPPKFLKRRIQNSGGNVAWLAAEPSYQATFHRAYCRLIGKEIPIEKVWA